MLVVLWRENAGEKLRRLVIHNVCTHKATQGCDTYYTADVFDFHMKTRAQGGTGLLSKDRFSGVIFVGDHGPHFSGAETIYNESCMYSKYKVILHCRWFITLLVCINMLFDPRLKSSPNSCVLTTRMDLLMVLVW